METCPTAFAALGDPTLREIFTLLVSGPRALLAWHLDGDRDYDPDPARASTVEITFTPEGSGTRVELVHSAFERHFAKPDRVREGVSGEGGRGANLVGFRQAFV
ncbi:SRPBCC domain-containing protein [Lentzea sp. NBC_00516]|uniref:SRPBCC domain-containing protein n=1 Tax=Lentzea sp. NBC_00516 TaxID=2903582 RepID=UPI002E80CF05|nr:SRPBCC domain-containing protein [Lentzea sp. NBC_00516]WUD29370.1 SRPBCC domain-containing protein [Lentzea sp. NBC_00516]